MFAGFNWQQMISAFIVLFAVIDIIGSIPIIINLKEKGKDVNAMKATVISFALLIGFFYAGDMMLKLFHVDIESFAVAGAFWILRFSRTRVLSKKQLWCRLSFLCWQVPELSPLCFLFGQNMPVLISL